MYGEVLATLTTPQPNHPATLEYTLFDDSLQIRRVRSRETEVWRYPLREFSADEVTVTFRDPFVIWTAFSKFLLCAAVATAFAWVALTAGRATPDRQHVVDAAIPLGLLVGFAANLGVRYHQHDRREWRAIEFRCRNKHTAATSVAIMSPESAYAEQEHFLELLRRQVQRAKEVRS